MVKRLIAAVTVLCLIFSFGVISYAEDVLTVNGNVSLGINARAYALMDVNTGTLITGKNENEQLYPASVTKIMSLLLVMEAIEDGKMTLDMEITCSASAAEKGGSQIWLEAGEVMTVNDLLKATVVYSANDACCLLGEVVAGSEQAFCDLMNKKAEELGMTNTHFDNCTGLDDDTTTHKTTARDIAVMSRALLRYPLIREYTGIWMDTLRNGQTQLVNTNKIIRTYPGATGLKTGTTSKAGCCVSASAERDGLELIAVVLGADNSKERFSGAKELLDYGFSNYEIYIPDSSGLYPEFADVAHGIVQKVKLEHIECGDFLVNKGIKNSIKTEVTLNNELEAPVEKGSVVGEITYKYNNEILGTSEIITAEEAKRMTFSNAIITILKSVKKY
ncbi:MAG: D-alanyl-D-alanine carboxypeptidase [Clostridia bacterium]|nr:D-alanyl-D-alanine carboxypeptidase [Clostridia bacterium]